jgi:DNA adenine methylase|tara:strand:- start:1342 stop:2106 length:765 start_codon:yes stop_codon:yes gene_type:complete
MKSPLRYPGGKTRACKTLDEIINEKGFDKSVVISPFFGGGSFEFFLCNKYGSKLIVNDKFKPLISFWKSVQTRKVELCSELRKLLNVVSKSIFSTMRDTIMEDTDDFIQGYKYFVINRCSFSGATLSGGFSTESSKKRFTESSIKRTEDLNLNDVEFHNLDFETFLKGKKGLIFLDPPYYLNENSNLYGKNGDMHENFNHEKLFQVLKKRKNWIMTYNNCDYIRDLYKNYEIREVKWSYGMNASKESSEIVIIG